jgi:hypothetical protein
MAECCHRLDARRDLRPLLNDEVFSASGTTFAWTSMATRSVGPLNRPSALQKSYSASPVT